MGDKSFVNSVKQAFESMQYGEGVENVNKALEWLKNRNNTISSKKGSRKNCTIKMAYVNNSNETLCTIDFLDNDFISNVLDTINKSDNKWIDMSPLRRTELLLELETEIRKQSRLICELELTTRGISCKDTQRLGLPLLTDYIRFYSSFPINYGQENPTWKPPGLCVGVFPDTSPLFLLGMFLGSSLAAGYNVILYTKYEFSVIATLIQDIATKIGIPSNTITVIPSDFGDLDVIFTNENVAMLTIFDDLYREEYNLNSISNKKILNLSSTGAPMVVFEGADLDSACQSAVEAVWGYRGMAPWSTKNLLIQESIFDDFVNRLKQRVDKIRTSSTNDPNADIFYKTDALTLFKLNDIVEKAKNHGSEIYPEIYKFEHFTPILLIGGNIFNNNVLKDNCIDIPIVNLRRFRTINEAVLLANNTRQSLGVSVWTENLNLANEIVEKLDNTTIWINDHGKFLSYLPISLIKNNGGYFGGKQGFYEYVNINVKPNRECVQFNNGGLMEDALKKSMKAQEIWSKQTRFERVKKFQTISLNLNSIRDKFSELIDDWITKIAQYIVKDFNDANIIDNSFKIATQRRACGVIVIETPENLDLHNKTLIITALIEGNSVILLNESKPAIGFYKLLQNLLPNGLLQLVDLSQESIKIAALYKELNVYLGDKFVEITSTLPLKDRLKFKAIPTDSNEIRDRVTFVKNIWSTSGQSFL